MELGKVIGLLFLAIGALLVLASFVIPERPGADLFGVNLNLAWGAVLFVFGGAFYAGARQR